MKVLLINGSPHANGCTYTALSEVAKVLKAEGIETQIFHIGKGLVRGCIACGGCAKQGRTVLCVRCWLGRFMPAAALPLSQRPQLSAQEGAVQQRPLTA